MRQLLFMIIVFYQNGAQRLGERWRSLSPELFFRVYDSLAIAPSMMNADFCTSVKPTAPVMSVLSYGRGALMTVKQSPVCVSHILIVPSSLLLAMFRPSELKATARNTSVCPYKTYRQSYTLKSQIRIV
jgi:hypothetical protein